MTETSQTRNVDASVQSNTRGDLRPINPTDIQIPQSATANTKEVERIVQILKSKGSLPEIIIAPDNSLIRGIDALEAAIQVGQTLILASVQKLKIETSKIQLTNIKLDGGTQSRAGINQQVVDEYAVAWRDGAKFPAIIVFYDGENYWLADGFHRCYSAKQAGLSEIEADIRQGTRRDAVLHSVGANSNHGLRRTNEDKRRAIQTLLNDDEWRQWSDREIARRCGVHHDTVGRIRAELTTTTTQATDNLSGGNRQIDERKVERGGTTYTQKTRSKAKPWIPKETEIVEVTGGEHKDKLAEVRVITGNTAMCFVDGSTKHVHILLSHMQPQQEKLQEPPTSVTQELKQKQKDLGLGTRSQIFPDKERNEGFKPEQQLASASIVDLNTNGDALVTEVAIALLKLAPKQMYEVMCRIEPELGTDRLNAIWKALEKSLAHKAA
ncbi:hypothetical protein [Nostoc linckia]|uniref:hypothetical protein n=1 Tax=Nostoc linckia TaxID=92942 RepID=UPI000C00081A|nr:hypothetical protein [Nostoc linckia]